MPDGPGGVKRDVGLNDDVSLVGYDSRMMKIWDPLPLASPLDIAVHRKRLLPNLDALVPDGRLALALGRHLSAEVERLAQPNADPDSEPLTLVSALTAAREVAETLEFQLSIVVPNVSARARKQLADELPNHRDGLLHTMSELGLTLELFRQGWSVDCAVPYWGDRDVDIVAEKQGDRRLIEVVNVQARRLVNTPTGFMAIRDVPEMTDHLAAMVATKAKKKFGDAVIAGWRGRAWVALDATKDDAMYVSSRILGGRSPDWTAEVARRLAPQFPQLEGVLFYSYTANSPTATDLRWHPC